MRPYTVCLLFLASFLAFAAPAQAHRPSDAFLSLTVSDSTVEGSLEIALRDLNYVIGLDADLDDAITWRELKAQHEAVAAYALARLKISSEDASCTPRTVEQLVSKHRDGSTFAVLRFAAECAQPVDVLQLDYNLLFDVDPLHRGLVQVEGAGKTHTAIFSPERRSWRLQLASPDTWQQVVTYLREGVWHIWIGIDHVLFLLSLLLPAVRRFVKGGWEPVDSLRYSFIEVAKVVTAFTFAHSITLGLATLGWLDLPSRLVESIIAASIVLAALNNIFPVVTRGLWVVAFGFGLIHGVGFAGALQDLGLPSDALIVSLGSFNLGVEFGQLAIVSLFLPLAFGLRHTTLYTRVVFQLGSGAIAAVATLWLVERAFNVTLLT